MQAPALQTAISERKLPDYDLLAKLVVIEGKPFKSSALAAGYSMSVAASGLKRLVETSGPVAEAIRRASDSLYVGLDKLKPLAVKRLYEEIINPKSANGMKAIELAGRFKETDWFVRNAEVSLGVFMALGENPPDAASAAIEAYVEPEKP